MIFLFSFFSLSFRKSCPILSPIFKALFGTVPKPEYELFSKLLLACAVFAVRGVVKKVVVGALVDDLKMKAFVQSPQIINKMELL